MYLQDKFFVIFLNASGLQIDKTLAGAFMEFHVPKNKGKTWKTTHGLKSVYLQDKLKPEGLIQYGISLSRQVADAKTAAASHTRSQVLQAPGLHKVPAQALQRHFEVTSILLHVQYCDA